VLRGDLPGWRTKLIVNDSAGLIIDNRNMCLSWHMSLLYNEASFYSICPLSRRLLLSHPPRILEVEPLEAPPPKHEERLEGLRERSDIPHDLVLRVAIEVFQQRLSTGIRPCAASAISTPGARRRLLMCCAISQLRTCFDNNASSNVDDFPMCTTCTCNES
jgi:hypothetical protein